MSQARRRKVVVLVIVALIFGAGGCETSTGPSITLPAGFLEMEYTGSIEGMLAVTGELRLDDGRVSRQEFAAGGANLHRPADKLTVVAFQPTGITGGTYFAITIPDVPAGTTVPIDAGCQEPACASALLLFGVGPNRPQNDLEPDVHRECSIDSGTLAVTGRTDDRVEGTFSGTGGCIARGSQDPVFDFAVQDASFDVPISFLFQPRINLP